MHGYKTDVMFIMINKNNICLNHITATVSPAIACKLQIYPYIHNYIKHSINAVSLKGIRYFFNIYLSEYEYLL